MEHLGVRASNVAGTRAPRKTALTDRQRQEAIPVRYSCAEIVSSVEQHVDAALAARDMSKPTVIVMGEMHGRNAAVAAELGIFASVRKAVGDVPLGPLLLVEQDQRINAVTQPLADHFVRSMHAAGPAHEARDTLSELAANLPPGLAPNPYAAAQCIAMAGVARAAGFRVRPFDLLNPAGLHTGTSLAARDEMMQNYALFQASMAGPGDILVVVAGSAHLAGLHGAFAQRGDPSNLVGLANVASVFDPNAGPVTDWHELLTNPSIEKIRADPGVDHEPLDIAATARALGLLPYAP